VILELDPIFGFRNESNVPIATDAVSGM